MTEVLAEAVVVIIAGCVSVSIQETVHLDVTRCSMSISSAKLGKNIVTIVVQQGNVDH